MRQVDLKSVRILTSRASASPMDHSQTRSRGTGNTLSPSMPIGSRRRSSLPRAFPRELRHMEGGSLRGSTVIPPVMCCRHCFFSSPGQMTRWSPRG